MPGGSRNQHTGRTVKNCQAHPDGIQCPYCKYTETKFRFFNNKKKTQPRYECLNSECKKFWTVGGTTRAPYNTLRRAMRNPVVADAALQPPTTAAADATSQPPPPATATVRRSQRAQIKKVDPKNLGEVFAN